MEQLNPTDAVSDSHKKRKRWMRLGVSAVLVAALLWVCVVVRRDAAMLPRCYMTTKQYAKALALPGIPCAYDDFVACMGQPETIQETVTENGVAVLHASYGDIVYSLYADSFSHKQEKSEYRLLKITITGGDLQFGRKRIGIGSSAADVQRAYRGNLTCYAVIGEGAGYIDGEWLYVRFLYDDSDVVTQITITLE